MVECEFRAQYLVHRCFRIHLYSSYLLFKVWSHSLILRQSLTQTLASLVASHDRKSAIRKEARVCSKLKVPERTEQLIVIRRVIGGSDAAAKQQNGIKCAGHSSSQNLWNSEANSDVDRCHGAGARSCSTPGHRAHQSLDDSVSFSIKSFVTGMNGVLP